MRVSYNASHGREPPAIRCMALLHGHHAFATDFEVALVGITTSNTIAFTTPLKEIDNWPCLLTLYGRHLETKLNTGTMRVGQIRCVKK